MTLSQVKRSTDRRLDRFKRSTDRHFKRIDRRFAEVNRRFAQSAAENRRHMDMIAETLRDDLRIFADAIGLHTDRLNKHDVRIARLENRSLA